MSIRRAAAALLLGVAAVVATATPAFAHAEPAGSSSPELVGSSPRVGASLAEPQLVMLAFNEPVTLSANPITITGENGASWTVGKPKVSGPIVTAPVQKRGPLGPYTLTYNFVSGEGDAVTGTVSFTLISPDAGKETPARPAPPGTASPTAGGAGGHGPVHTLPGAAPDPAAASTSDSGGPPVWVWILGAVAVLALALLEALRIGRSRRS